MTAPSEAREVDRSGAPLTVFAALWAVAALFHVLGPSGRATGIVDHVTAVGLGHVAVAIAALVVLVAPARTLPLATLAVLGPLTAWQEAPVLGNHWFVVALVDVGLLLALLASRTGWSVDRGRLSEGFLPVARWVLVAFYAFAAFAKLNHGFLDTSVSCSAVYFDETARTLGLTTPLAVGRGGWAALVPIASIAIELAVPVLLCVRRTRKLGVVVGLLFHSAIALDQEHLFSDFSATLSALFVLFLPAGFAAGVVDAVRRWGRIPVVAWAGLAAITLIAQWSPPGDLVDTVLVDGRMWLWYLVDGALLAAVLWWAMNDRSPGVLRSLQLVRRPRWLAVVPALALLNGLAPYVELKTAFSYTMYANLRTDGGETNHLLVPRTAPIGDRLSSLVRIESSDDAGLATYAHQGYLLPWDSLRAYLAGHGDAAVRYTRDGVTHDLAHASDDPELVDPPPKVLQKLAPLRSVDERDPPRCQESFLPAL